MKDNIKVPFIFWFSWVEKTIEGFHSENFDVESFRISVSQEKFKKLGFMYWFIRIFFGTTRNYIIKHKNNKLSIFWYRYCIYLFIFIFKCNGYLYLLFINKETKKLNWYKREYITKIKLQHSFKCQKWNINQNKYLFWINSWNCFNWSTSNRL